MSNSYLLIQKSEKLSGIVEASGSKNASLAIIASLVLVQGVSVLHNIPYSADIIHMIQLLEELGAFVNFDAAHHCLTVDTTELNGFCVREEVMNKMRASIVVAGPLLARFGKAEVAFPGGCAIGKRPIDLHLKGFADMNVVLQSDGRFLKGTFSKEHQSTSTRRIILDYPSVGATENIMMLATKTPGTTVIINAAHEPEVFDLIKVLQKMGADIEPLPGSSIVIKGVEKLHPIEHHVISDRLEAGALLLAAAMTGGEVFVPNACTEHMDLFLEKLHQMGHFVSPKNNGVFLQATTHPRAISLKTGPYPNFPTDLQALMLTAQCVANGTSVIEETVFESRFMHVHELQKMGAQISLQNNVAVVRGVDSLYGTEVIAPDIRASCALVLAGLIAEGTTKMTGLTHWRRGYDNLEKKLQSLGARIWYVEQEPTAQNLKTTQKALL